MSAAHHHEFEPVPPGARRLRDRPEYLCADPGCGTRWWPEQGGRLPIWERVLRETEHLFHPYHEHQQPQEPTVSLTATIEQDLTAAGHAVDDVLHGALARHLTLAKLAGHVAGAAAGLEASPVVQALERAALGPAGEQVVASLVDGLAGLFAPVPVAAAPELQPVPVAVEAPLPGPEPEPAGPQVSGVA